MSERVAVSIGIERAGNLTKLPGAVNGAKEFKRWAEQQNYKCYLVTDENNVVVTTQQLKDLFKKIIDEDEPKRLIVYFAGHGIQPGVNSAYWLLSGWEDDSDEAVNFTLSSSNAKRSGIKQIAVFADACRSQLQGGSSVGGRSIFPKGVRSNRMTEWDQFLATRLDDSAQEVPGTDPTKAYGIFSNCLMQALQGSAEKAVEERGGGARVVTSGKLRAFLEEAVPFESGRTPGASVQYPDCSPGWAGPEDVYAELSPPGIAHAIDLAMEALTGTLKSVTKGLSDPLVIIGGDGGPTRDSDNASAAVAASREREESTLRASEELFSAAQGREGFETRQGLTIVGAEPVRIEFRAGQQAELFEEGGTWSIRGHGGQPQTVMIELQGGNWIGACVLPEFVGTIVVKENSAASVSYMPARNSQEISRDLFLETNPMIQKWTALMHQGRFADKKALNEIAGSLRVEKHANPSLGILAAYMYERAGNLRQIDSIARYFAEARQPVPFDVAMLSQSPIKHLDTGLTIDMDGWSVPVAGSFPLMTQGWALLDPDDDFVHRKLPAIGRGLVPSLWTTLGKAAGRRLADLIAKGDL